jgi:hypothetical protein
MDEISKAFQQLWENEAGPIVLLVVGLAVLTFFLVHVWRQKRRSKRPD